MPDDTNFTEEITKWVESLPNWGKAAVAGGVALAVYIPFKFLSTQKRNSPVTENWKPDVVYLYQFPRTRVLPNLSTFCMKVETWLRMADINYEIPKCPITLRTQEGTLPFVELNGKEYYDSSFILRDVDEAIKPQHPSLDDHLSVEQKAVSRAFEAMIEKSMSISAWFYRMENTEKMLDLFDPKVFGLFSSILKMINSRFYASTLLKRISGSDIGFHNRDDIIKIGSDDLKSISKYLGNKHYFHGFKPTKVDACLFANLCQIYYAPYTSEHRDLIVGECKNLQEYVERIKNRYWPDWDDVTSKYSTETSNWKKRHIARNGNGKQAH
ncbi:Protein CBG20802 [Caenorhabditis briggsae]|uniref:Protein CBG20802 n=1 Tax=Caenorhabditis briggsae TaxID=6238 RepID=A8XYN3_CAEBR|nr:Protein CBG20802 [Caenorhabditis briggsae]CAP37749.2 Protein CBG20802 [Caenorhabditis briggsae]